MVPSKLTTRALALAREGHPEKKSMKPILQSNAWWPSIDKDVEIFCETCFCCHLVGNLVHSEPVKSVSLPRDPL